MLENSVLNGLSVKLTYKIVFLKNKRLRPLVKIIIRIAYRKKFSVSKATCPESVFKTVQIILWETPVIKSSREVFINVKLVRVLPLRTNLASFFNNKHFLKKIPVGSCAKSFILFYFIRFFIHSELQIFFSIRDAAYWTTSFWIASYEISF